MQTKIRFQNIDILPQLKGHIKKIWAFESAELLPGNDLKLIVPNERLLLLMPFRNGLIGRKGDKLYTASENKIALVGMSDTPSVINSQTDGPTGSIGVELCPASAYRFLRVKLNDIKSQVYYMTDVLGKSAKIIEHQMEEKESVVDKARLLQQFLFTLFTQKDADPLFEYCIRQIEVSKGKITVQQLERKAGYSSRWLNMKFDEKIGLSPKTLSSIVRFQQYYQAIIWKPVEFLRAKDFYHQYYDASHFIKDFKRFTGMSPTKIITEKNEFGKLFYQD